MKVSIHNALGIQKIYVQYKPVDDVGVWAIGNDNKHELSDPDIAECVLSETGNDETEFYLEEAKLSYDDVFLALVKSLEFVELKLGRYSVSRALYLL